MDIGGIEGNQVSGRELTEKLMANEGSTKATYSELETIIDRCHLALGEDPNSDDATLPEAIAAHLDGEKEALKRWQTAETSLARVRGLLQRQWISVEERLPEPYCTVVLVWAGMLITGFRADDGTWRTHDNATEPRNRVTHWMPIFRPTFPQSSSLVSQGAESADIGKHSCADELCDGHCDDQDCPKRKRVDIGKLDSADKKGEEA